MTDISQHSKDWKLNNSHWDKFVLRRKNSILLKDDFVLSQNNYGAEHQICEIVHKDSKRQVALINNKKTNHLSFCIISIENDKGNRVLL